MLDSQATLARPVGSPAPPASDTLRILQAGRGLAAMAVVFHHACNGVVRQGGELPEWFIWLCGYGYLGVDFFFVLSGFIIYYVNQSRRDQPRFASKYIEARLIRVYVPYLPLGIMMGLAYVALPQLASGDNDWNWFTTLTLLPSSAFPALAPAWTLQHEIIFYFVALLAFQTRSFVALSICAIGAATAVRLLYPLGYKGFGLIDLEFIFGIVAAWCFINNRATWNIALALTGAAICGVFFVIDDRMLSVLFGLGLALMLLPLVRAERAGWVKVGPILFLLGNASYAIYLVHQPLVAALSRVLTSTAGGAISFVVIVLAGTVGGIAYHKIYELPALRITKRWISQR